MLWLAIGLGIGFIIGFALGHDEMEKKIKRKIKKLFDSSEVNFFDADLGNVDSEYFYKNLFGEE